MATTPPLIGRTVEHRIGDAWVQVIITEQSGGSIAAKPVSGRFPDGSTRLVASFPLNSDWRV
jgi:hypothetical protein